MSNIRKLPFPWHAGILSVLLGGISTASVAILCYLVPYWGGRGMIHWALASQLSFWLFVFGWGVAVLIFFLLHRLFQTTQHNSVNVSTGLAVVCMFLAHFLIWFQIGPLGRIWTNGLIAGINSNGHLHELQMWGIERLTEYQKGTLKTVASADSPPLSIKKLDPTIIPEYVKNIGGTPPSEGIKIAAIPSQIVNPDTVFDKKGFEGYCIAISWYNFGILVGSPPDFKSQPDSHRQWTYPWNIQEVQPGIWVYYNEK